MIEESRRAELVVVGSRGLGGFTGLLLGSVGAQVAAHAHCPVLVVRPDEQPIPVDGPVLVGVDGSESSRLAVGLGADEAGLRDVPLVLVHVGPPDGDRTVPEEIEESQAAYQAEAVRLLADASAVVRAEHPDLVVREHPVRAAGAAQGLIEASGTASLLVVGTRGRAGFAGLLLGSVSQAAIQHAHCPVLVAHTRSGDRRAAVASAEHLQEVGGEGERVGRAGGRLAGARSGRPARRRPARSGRAARRRRCRRPSPRRRRRPRSAPTTARR